MRTITLNIIKGYGLTPMLNVSQFDKGYTVVATVQKGAEAFTPPTGSTATVEGRKPDGTGYQYAATIDGSTVTFTMAEQMTVLSGRSMAEIVFYDADSVRIGTANFYIIVEAAPLNEETVISDTELPAVIDAANANAERAEDAADEAEATLANFAAVVAEQVEQMQIHEGQTVIDATLTVSGAAADAKVTGDKVAEVKNDSLAQAHAINLAGAAVIAAGSLSQNSITFSSDGKQISINGSSGASFYAEIDSEVTKITDLTGVHNRTHLTGGHTYRFKTEKISGSFEGSWNYVSAIIADGTSGTTRIYELSANGQETDVLFDDDKDISICAYVRYGTVVSDLIFSVELIDMTALMTATTAEKKADNLIIFFPETTIKNDYVSGSSSIATNRRVFLGNDLPADGMIKTASVYIGSTVAGCYVVCELWEFDDTETTLTRVFEKKVLSPAANAWLDFDINYSSTKKMLLSFYKNGCYIFNRATGVVGEGIYYTDDITSATLNVSDLVRQTAMELACAVTYLTSSVSEDKYVRSFGERVTNATYATVLPDLDNATPNVIYDIHQCLHSIANIPSGIDSSLTSATFYSVKGDTIDSMNWVVQYLIPNGNETRVFCRNRMDGSWKAWKELGGVPQDANLLSLDYYNGDAVNKKEIGVIDSTKTLLIFGDSITAGSTDTSWTSHFQTMTGCTIINNAVAGSTYGESTSNLWISTQIAGVTEQQWADADLVILSAGTNDGLHNTPDTEIKEKVQSAIDTIRTHTNAPIIFITPIRRNTPSYSENLKLPYIGGIIANVAVSNQCNVVCGFNFPLSPQTLGVITNLTRDGLHPNAVGANAYARALIGRIQ